MTGDLMLSVLPTRYWLVLAWIAIFGGLPVCLILTLGPVDCGGGSACYLFGTDWNSEVEGVYVLGLGAGAIGGFAALLWCLGVLALMLGQKPARTRRGTPDIQFFTGSLAVLGVPCTLGTTAALLGRVGLVSSQISTEFILRISTLCLLAHLGLVIWIIVFAVRRTAAASA